MRSGFRGGVVNRTQLVPHVGFAPSPSSRFSVPHCDNNSRPFRPSADRPGLEQNELPRSTERRTRR